MLTRLGFWMARHPRSGQLIFVLAIMLLVGWLAANDVVLPRFGPSWLTGLPVLASIVAAVWLRQHRKKVAKTFNANLLPVADWQLVDHTPTAAYWRDHAGDAVSLTRGSANLVSQSLSDDLGLQRYCRDIAESQKAGLVEVASGISADGPCLTYVYKRLERPAFKFFGVVAIPAPQATWIWTVVALERGMTGVREAAVTAKLFETGKLTIESYKTSWAQDPYDSTYAGVDRSTLRYLSDSSEYDNDFPDHPLTKVRRELRRLAQIRITGNTDGAA